MRVSLDVGCNYLKVVVNYEASFFSEEITIGTRASLNLVDIVKRKLFNHKNLLKALSRHERARIYPKIVKLRRSSQFMGETAYEIYVRIYIYTRFPHSPKEASNYPIL